jgi:hypothetical protein
VIVANDLIVVSNMPIEKEEIATSTLYDKYQRYNYIKPFVSEDVSGVIASHSLLPKKRVRFQITPLTSTYLNTFVASYFEWLEKLIVIKYSYPRHSEISFTLHFISNNQRRKNKSINERMSE